MLFPYKSYFSSYIMLYIYISIYRRCSHIFPSYQSPFFIIFHLVGGFNLSEKYEPLCQLGWFFHSQLNGKITFIFQTTKQIESYMLWLCWFSLTIQLFGHPLGNPNDDWLSQLSHSSVHRATAASWDHPEFPREAELPAKPEVNGLV